MRIALLDRCSKGPWQDGIHRLAYLVPLLSADGHEPILVDISADETIPFLAGTGREEDALPLIDAARALRAIRACDPDICLTPVRDGLPHGLLMARACGELEVGLRIILVAERSSRTLALAGDVLGPFLRPLIADAMERFCLAEADGLLSEANTPLELELPGASIPPVLTIAGLPSLSSGAVVRASRKPCSLLAFVGPFDRSAVAFIDCVERLAATGWMDGKSVAFVGQVGDADLAPGKTWLGRRASRWSFPFKVLETDSFREALAIAFETGDVAIIPDMPAAFHSLCNGFTLKLVASQTCSDGMLLEDVLRSIASNTRGEEALGGQHVSFGALAEVPLRRGVSGSSPCGLSICILHFNRADLLAIAVRSVLDQAASVDLEVIILDNGSTEAGVGALLDELEEGRGCTILRVRHPVPVATAMNRMAARARMPYLVFLDDDNVMADGGIGRLARACGQATFDVITSTLEVFDDNTVTPGPTAGILTFIGPAETAGLFFNAFGDTAMAFKREAFEAIGGFLEMPGPYPAPDWLLLARAQAAGLRIGVLQTPAFRYRRGMAKEETSWQKFDQHGVRRLLLQNYGHRFDPMLIAKLSQSLILDRM